jgi:hypothetical protein
MKKVTLKVNLKRDTDLFDLKSEAIAYILAKNIGFKPYDWFNERSLYNCGKDCSKECEEVNEHWNPPQAYEVIDIYELDNITLVQINSRGNLLWTSEFEKVEE